VCVPSDLSKTRYRYLVQDFGNYLEEKDSEKVLRRSSATIIKDITTMQTDNERHISTGDKHSKALDLSGLYIMVIYLLSFALTVYAVYRDLGSFPV
jgi:hypothetical protein